MWKRKATGCIMAKCRNCNIEILDASEYCPLCRSVLDPDEALVSMYPNARVSMRRLHLLGRIYLFSIILAEAVLALVNVLVSTEVWWSAIAGLGLLYSYLVLRYAIIGRSGHRSKAFVLILMGVLLAIAVDFVLGYRGWAVDFFLPAGILIMDLVILICLIVNRKNWQSYIMWLIGMLLVSVIPAALFVNQLENYWYIACSPIFMTVALLLGVFIIGGERATEEMRRRFHVN